MGEPESKAASVRRKRAQSLMEKKKKSAEQEEAFDPETAAPPMPAPSRDEVVASFKEKFEATGLGSSPGMPGSTSPRLPLSARSANRWENLANTPRSDCSVEEVVECISELDGRNSATEGRVQTLIENQRTLVKMVETMRCLVQCASPAERIQQENDELKKEIARMKAQLEGLDEQSPELEEGPTREAREVDLNADRAAHAAKSPRLHDELKVKIRENDQYREDLQKRVNAMHRELISTKSEEGRQRAKSMRAVMSEIKHTPTPAPKPLPEVESTQKELLAELKEKKEEKEKAKVEAQVKETMPQLAKELEAKAQEKEEKKEEKVEKMKDIQDELKQAAVERSKETEAKRVEQEKIEQERKEIAPALSGVHEELKKDVAEKKDRQEKEKIENAKPELHQELLKKVEEEKARTVEKKDVLKSLAEEIAQCAEEGSLPTQQQPKSTPPPEEHQQARKEVQLELKEKVEEREIKQAEKTHKESLAQVQAEVRNAKDDRDDRQRSKARSMKLIKDELEVEAAKKAESRERAKTVVRPEEEPPVKPLHEELKEKVNKKETEKAQKEAKQAMPAVHEQLAESVAKKEKAKESKEEVTRAMKPVHEELTQRATAGTMPTVPDEKTMELRDKVQLLQNTNAIYEERQAEIETLLHNVLLAKASLEEKVEKAENDTKALKRHATERELRVASLEQKVSNSETALQSKNRYIEKLRLEIDCLTNEMEALKRANPAQ